MQEDTPATKGFRSRSTSVQEQYQLTDMERKDSAPIIAPKSISTSAIHILRKSSDIRILSYSYNAMYSI